MKRDIVWTTQFKKDYKLALKRHLNIDLLDDMIRALSRGETLPERNKDHALSGDWAGHRECHIQPDWLLVYRIEDDVLVLTRPHRDAQRFVRKMKAQAAVWKNSVRRFCSAHNSCSSFLPFPGIKKAGNLFSFPARWYRRWAADIKF